MKRQAYTMIAMIVLAGSMAVAAQAQTSGRTKLIANIPFEFSVGNKTLPAGEYTIRQLNPPSGTVSILQLRSRDGRANVLVPMYAVSGKAQENARLIFNRYGNRYYFAQVWVGTNAGLEASKSQAERAAQRQLATPKPAAEAIALRTR